MKNFKGLKTFLQSKIFLILFFIIISKTDIYSYTIFSDTVSKKNIDIRKDFLTRNPARAGLYSAILPGLGQAYNKQYWKIPLAWALVGGLGYVVINENREYNKLRTEYKRRLSGLKPDYLDFVDNERLVSYMRVVETNRDTFVLYTILGYVINIIDANVSAHLSGFNVDNIANIKPQISPEQNYVGLSIKFNL